MGGINCGAAAWGRSGRPSWNKIPSILCHIFVGKDVAITHQPDESGVPYCVYRENDP